MLSNGNDNIAVCLLTGTDLQNDSTMHFFVWSMGSIHETGAERISYVKCHIQKFSATIYFRMFFSNG